MRANFFPHILMQLGTSFPYLKIFWCNCPCQPYVKYAADQWHITNQKEKYLNIMGVKHNLLIFENIWSKWS